MGRFTEGRLAAMFARRFLFAGKSHSVINVMSWVSVVAVGIPVAAMVILMSVFNGFDRLVRSMYSDFETELTVSPVRGAVFQTDIDTAAVNSIEGVRGTTYILDGDVLLSYRGRQTTARIRGVDNSYASLIPVEGMMAGGEYRLNGDYGDQMVLGQGVAYELGMHTCLLYPVTVYAPSRGHYSKLIPSSGVQSADFMPSGVFSLDADTDGKYVLASIDAAQRLLDYAGRASGLMIRLDEGAPTAKICREVQKIVGQNLKVETREQRNASMYRVLTLEKWAVFFIGLMILLIASFSVVGSLTMLIIDKGDNIRTLAAMGGSLDFVRKIFVRQGMMICMAGAVGGLFLGVVLSAVQQYFGVIRIPAETFLIDAYPVVIEPFDIAAVVVSFIVISYIITKFTVRGRITTRSLC